MAISGLIGLSPSPQYHVCLYCTYFAVITYMFLWYWNKDWVELNCTLWKGQNNRIWFQTKDNVMMEPDRIGFDKYKSRHWNPAFLFPNSAHEPAKFACRIINHVITPTARTVTPNEELGVFSIFKGLTKVEVKLRPPIFSDKILTTPSPPPVPPTIHRAR